MSKRWSEQDARAIPAVAAAIDKADAEARANDGAPEAQVVAEITAALRVMGYVLPADFKAGMSVTGFYMRTGQRRADQAGNDKGLSDLFVWDIKRGWFAFEVKSRAKGANVRHEQRILAEFGAHRIVSSAREVLDALKSGEAAESVSH